MKIQDYLQIQQQLTKTGQGKNQGTGFADALAEAGEKCTGDPKVATASSVQGLMAASPVGGIIAAAQASPGVQINNVVTALEKYSSALADSTKSLKDIEPMVRNLESGAAKLDQLSKNLPADSQLKGLAQQTGTLAAVEAMKFRRGDYV